MYVVSFSKDRRSLDISGRNIQKYDVKRAANLTGVLLLGGRSRRFGSDKTQAPLGGTTLAGHAHRALSEVCSCVLLSVSKHSSPGELSGCLLLDDVPDRGPLGGILTAFSVSTEPYLVVLAGDLPRIRPATLSGMVMRFESGVLIARNEQSGRVQPLCAVWSREASEQLEEYLESGHRSVLGFLEGVDTHEFDLPPEELVNINRPGDLEDVR